MSLVTSSVGMVSVSSRSKHRDTTCPLISWGHGGGKSDLEGRRRRTGRQVLGTFVECCALCGLLKFLLALILLGPVWVRRAAYPLVDSALKGPKL